MTIDRSRLSPVDIHDLDVHRAYSAARRERNRAAGLCINSSTRAPHGTPTHGVRCARCHETHRRSR